MVGITAAQFHLPFYTSRTLPNTFATGLACLALGDWISGNHPRRATALLVFGTVRPGIDVCWSVVSPASMAAAITGLLCAGLHVCAAPSQTAVNQPGSPQPHTSSWPGFGLVWFGGIYGNFVSRSCPKGTGLVVWSGSRWQPSLQLASCLKGPGLVVGLAAPGSVTRSQNCSQ